MLARRIAIALLVTLVAATAGAEPLMDAVARDLAPTGRLRAAINLGNVVLAHRGPAGELAGVSVDLATELGRRLGLEVDLVPYDAAGQVTDAAEKGVWDVAFLAVDPVRANAITYTSPYVLIEGTYAVAESSPLHRVEDFDQEGVRIAVGRGSAYDLYLSRNLKRASLVRTTTSADAIALFIGSKLDAVAGVKQPLVTFVRETPGYRVVEGRFMAIEQAVGVPRGHDLAARYLKEFVEELKASGFVAASLERHRQKDAVVAPPAPVR